jgi:hypothetical protein
VKNLVSRVVLAVALVGAMTVGADAGKARAHHRAAKAIGYATTYPSQPAPRTYTYRYYGGPKGQMWPVPQ